MTLGDDLYALVEAYTALGDHRTGTFVDAQTATWLAQALADRGLVVEERPVPFDRWVATSKVTAGGIEIEHLAVPYEFTGVLETDEVHVGSFDPASGGFPELLDEQIESALGAGARATVLATEHANGSLVGINRVYGSQPSGMPTMLIACRDFERTSAGPVEVSIEARLVPGKTTNVVAASPGSGKRPVLLTTPLTGWFGCAGERATGIAVLLHLVERFADEPLLVVATGGHELHWFGVERWIGEASAVPEAVVHVGASVAVEEDDPDGGRRLAGSRLAMTSIPEIDTPTVAAALEPARLALYPGAERWIGEGQAWATMSVPLLSLSGAGVDFHTPEDTPERVTSPDSLAIAAEAIGDAVAAMLGVLR